MSSLFSDQPARSGPNGVVVLAVMGIGMTVGIVFLAWLGTPRITPTVGQTLSKIDLSPIAYADKSLSENDLKGKVTLMHFWGTWSAPCRDEFPEFAKLAREFVGREDVQVISISSSAGPEYDLPALGESTKAFLTEQECEVPTYADPAGLTRSQVGSLLVDSSLPYPCTLLLDREAVVRSVWTNYEPGNMAKVKQQLEQMLR